MKKIKVLFFAANPVLTSRLSIEEEIRAITEKIKTSKPHSSIDLVLALAVRTGDLLQNLNEYKPQIVHFSGHGEPTGELLLIGGDGKPKPVSAVAIHELFRTLKNNIRVVVLNACYSKIQAQEIKKEIDCVIGMKNSISDHAAIIFSAYFYSAIGFGCSIQNAFEQGKTALLLEGIPEDNIPELLVREGVDPSRVFLMKTTAKSKTPDDEHSGRKIGEHIVQPPINGSNGSVIEENTPGIMGWIQGIINDLIRISNPFWIINIVILVPPLLSRFFTQDLSSMHELIKFELSIFWPISILVSFYLILTSFRQLRKTVETLKSEGIVATLRVSLSTFSIEIKNKPLRFVSPILLFLAFYIVIMVSYYFFQNHLTYYSLLIVMPNIVLIHVDPGKRFKRKTAEGIKILSIALLSFLILKSTFLENRSKKYFEWVDHHLFVDLVKSKSELEEKNQLFLLKRFAVTILNSMEKFRLFEDKAPIKPTGKPEGVKRETDFIIEEIPIEADALGKDYKDACLKAKDAAFKKYYTSNPQITSKSTNDGYKVDECKLIWKLDSGEVYVRIKIKIIIKKEKK